MAPGGSLALYVMMQSMFSLQVLYIRGPQPLDHRMVLVHGLLGTGPHSKRWTVGEQANLHLYLQPLPITCITT